ncbi:hypothetical protein C2E23DRAFT_838532 [Lenzites betulinus]|nr:hypothetical protein C2E23DRAFT_838532 [Lenzites betulinus]
MLNRPRAPTPNTIAPPQDDWSSDYESQSPGVSPSSGYVVNTPPSMLTPPPVVSSQSLSALGYTAFSSHNDEDGALSDSGYSHSSHPSTSTTTLPDPSQFPDPYPYRPSRWHLGTATPALSSADSSSASTRSSAYTGSAKSGDYGHVHVALGGEEETGRGVGVGITTDDVVQLMTQETSASSSASQSRTPIDQARWSDFYTRSRSASLANNKAEPAQEKPLPALRATPSFDMGWQRPDERDEAGVGSEDDLEDDPSFDDDEEVEDDDVADEPTSAALMAEEGRGVIVRGDDMPIVRLHVLPDTTHLLIGSSSTPNAVPAFLANTLPQICSSLLALDISANFLGALPPPLSACVNLEELNIAYNPLRALPTFLSTLTNLRVLIVDSTGISTLPESLASLERLHTLSVRRNKMHSLPSWLCELTTLETLLVDGNPFQGPWKALMEPLLSRSPMSPGYLPSTPMFPLHSASIRSTTTATTDGDLGEYSPPADRDAHEEEDLTVTSPRAPNLARSITAPSPNATGGQLPSPGLSRTRTTPNRAYYDKTRTSSKGPKSMFSEAGPSDFSRAAGEAEKEVRRMKSAGELRRNAQKTPVQSASSSPQRGALADYVGSASSSNLLSMGGTPQDSQSVPRRFASLGVATGAMSPTTTSRFRRTVDSNIWDSPTEEDTVAEPVPPLPSKVIFPQEGAYAMDHALPARPRMKEDKDKSSRWGFLKKMSMGKMRTDQPPPPTRSSLHQSQVPQQSPNPSRPTPPKQFVSTPLLDVRISTTGMLLQQQQERAMDEAPIASSLSRKHSNDLLKLTASPLDQLKKMSNEAAKQAPATSSNNLLAPPVSSQTSRANKRRSFLPIDVSPIPIPAASQFVPGITATNSNDGSDESVPPASSPLQRSPVQPDNSYEELQRREEDRAREARIRALRSVMAYLKDMHDLTRSQPQTLSIYGIASPDSTSSGPRSRRPTMVDNGRLASESTIGSIGSSGSSSRPESVNLRSTEGRTSVRTGSTTQTNSVATTDSTGSAGAEERKYKDDKSKRSRIIREIVETERTYVKGLQELVDIYIRPASAPVNGLGGVGQRQDTIVPAQERKIVFSGLEALFYFHRESFLPALERASAPLLEPAQAPQGDNDGQLSLYVARDVANTFVSHAAFMKMYSTYINNFDNSVQRIKTWTSDKPGAATPAQALSPSSSSAQLVGLGLAMSAGLGAGTAPDASVSASNSAVLSSSQRKRIKQYLKRCRLNPRHSQLNLEGYLLLPVQRIPRYRLLLEELVRSSPPLYEYMDDPIDRALNEIASLATNMNEGKRESESRRRLVQWQGRIRGKFPSPLVQPHRRLIMDGPLQLTRVVRKATVAFEVIDAQGDASSVEVECLSPELTPRALVGILCNDLLVLCRDPSEGQDPSSYVDLWAVLRMQTLPQPASIVHGNTLRLVDNKAILYFDAPSTSDALTWYRAINLEIPQSSRNL